MKQADKFVRQDLYLSQVPDEFADFEKKYREEQGKNKEEVVLQLKGTRGYSKKTDLIKNPRNASNIGEWARGIIDKNGNLYIERNQTTLHEDIINSLIEKKILSNTPNRSWWFKNPKERLIAPFDRGDWVKPRGLEFH